MTAARIPSVALVALLAAVLTAALLALQAKGYASASDLDLWGRTLLANDGLIALEDIVTAYPPLPYIGTIALSALAPALGQATPQWLAALLALALAGAWFVQLRRSGLGRGASFAVTFVLAINPLFLRAIAEGPGFILLHWGLWLLALGLFNLRRGHRVNDIILVSLALILVSLSHPFGLMLAVAGLPFLALVVPPDRLRDAPGGVFLVLLFPLLFTLLAFAYVNWVFAGDPLHFISGLSAETVGLGTAGADADGSATRRFLLAGLAMVAVCPLGIALLVKTRRLPPLHLAGIALLGTLIAASALAAMLGILPSPALIGGLAVTLAAACAIYWPRDRMERDGLVLPLLAAGWLGGLVVASADSADETARWRTALAGNTVAAADPELAELGRSLVGRRAILFDAETAPAIVAARGDASGIWTADTPQFQLAGLDPRPGAAVVVVRSQASGRGSDRVGRLFPDFFERGAENYRLLFDGPRWRAYVRNAEYPS